MTLTTPKVAYRETIKGTSSVQGKHKKNNLVGGLDSMEMFT